MNREALEQKQLHQLNELIERISGRNPFYTRKLQRSGLKNGVEDLTEFFQKMPFTTKKELLRDQQNSPPYGTNLTEPINRYTRFHQTSGTSTKPLHWLDTTESWQWVNSNWIKVFEAARVTSGDRIFFSSSFGPFLGFWSAFDAAKGMGCLSFPGGGMTSEARLQMMLDHQADVLCCTPTYALRLGEIAQLQNFPMERMQVRKIIVAGEPGGSIPSFREQIESLWGKETRVFDHHGMTETGPVSYECADRQGILHILETSYLAEILNPDTLIPVSEGETGELVLTALGREASPILRYRTGDIVRPSWQGKKKFASDDTALIGGLIGRIDDMVALRGINVFPSTIDSVICKMNGIAEYRVRILSKNFLTEINIDIEPLSQKEGREIALNLEKTLKQMLHVRIPVNLVGKDVLPRFEMKAKRWMKE